MPMLTRQIDESDPNLIELGDDACFTGAPGRGSKLTIHFRVVAPFTRPGDCILVAGSRPELGAWAVQGSLRLRTSSASFPLWEGHVQMDFSDQEVVSFSYKHVLLLSEGSQIIWEDGPNRTPILALQLAYRNQSAHEEWSLSTTWQGAEAIPSFLRPHALEPPSTTAATATATTSTAAAAAAEASADAHTSSAAPAAGKEDAVDSGSTSAAESPAAASAPSSSAASSQSGPGGELMMEAEELPAEELRAAEGMREDGQDTAQEEEEEEEEEKDAAAEGQRNEGGNTEQERAHEQGEKEGKGNRPVDARAKEVELKRQELRKVRRQFRRELRDLSLSFPDAVKLLRRLLTVRRAERRAAAAPSAATSSSSSSSFSSPIQKATFIAERTALILQHLYSLAETHEKDFDSMIEMCSTISDLSIDLEGLDTKVVGTGGG